MLWIFFIFMDSFGNTSSFFDERACLELDFEVKQERFLTPLKALKLGIEIKKTLCTLRLVHTRYTILKDHWEVDVCRSPVHIKKDSWRKSVIERKSGAIINREHIVETQKVQKVIESEGLIYAEGIKEDLSRAHGQMRCAAFLLDQYLMEGRVFNYFEHKEAKLEKDKKEGPISTKEESGPTVSF